MICNSDIKNRFRKLLMCPLFIIASTHEAFAAEAVLKDTEALADLKAVKSVFMVDAKEPARMVRVLTVIGKTSESLSKQGVKSELVVVVIGRSVAFLTKDRRGISYTDQRFVTAIHKGISELKSQGIKTEVCGVALKGMDVDPDALISDVVTVGNGYISAIGYQTQDYQLVPVY